MRLHLQLSPTHQIIAHNYQSILTGAIHKWLGVNSYHGSLSLFSFSWLRQANVTDTGFNFPNGSNFFISAHEADFLKDIIKGIQQDPSITKGLEVTSITLQAPPAFGTDHLFQVGSPILAKRKVENSEKHYTWNEEITDQLLTETLSSKLRSAGLDDQGLQVSFDRNSPFAKTKLIRYKKIGNKVNLCPIRIKGSPEQLTFAWNVGVGNSTGIGFGALK